MTESLATREHENALAVSEHHLVIGIGNEREAVKIETNYLPTLSAVRDLDWMAYAENWEAGDPMGHGATEQEAIDNLREELACCVHPPMTRQTNEER